MRQDRALVWILFATAIALPHPVWAEDHVFFADENLKEAVKERVEITTDPLPGEMLLLTQFDAGNRGITDLTGIEEADNLTDLQLDEGAWRRL